MCANLLVFYSTSTSDSLDFSKNPGTSHFEKEGGGVVDVELQIVGSVFDVKILAHPQPFL